MLEVSSDEMSTKQYGGPHKEKKEDTIEEVAHWWLSELWRKKNQSTTFRHSGWLRILSDISTSPSHPRIAPISIQILRPTLRDVKFLQRPASSYQSGDNNTKDFTRPATAMGY